MGSLFSAPRIMVEQPKKTITTVGAALVLRVLGKRVYGAIESMLLGPARRDAPAPRPAQA